MTDVTDADREIARAFNAAHGGCCDLELAQFFADYREASIAPYVEALPYVRGLLANSGATSGYCMCGDPIDSHSINSGHSPVDTHSYYAEQAIAQIDALLERGAGDNG